MEYEKRLNPERSLRTPKGITGSRQNVIVTHNPSILFFILFLILKKHIHVAPHNIIWVLR